MPALLDEVIVADNFQHVPNQQGFDNANAETSVLIVEDNEELRKYLLEVFSDFNVSGVSNGREGLERAREILPAIVVTDVLMPEMDGISLTRELKNDPKTSHIPVIILTARTALVYKNEGYEMGADDYISKPFSERLLRIRILNILNNRRLLAERFQKEDIVKPKELALPSQDKKFLEEVMSIIERNIEENDLKAELFVKELGMSHSVVYKKLKALTGLSIVEFVRDFKLKRAAQLIEQDELTISEVCYKVGFTDRRYFSLAFKKKFGRAPSEYVKNSNSQTQTGT